ncbi:MAG: hypothetical protein RR547_06605 [Raoultibacter sp.]
MSGEMNLPRLDSLSKLLITSDDLGRAKEADFVRGIKADKVKMLVTDNQISCVMLAPEVYAAFLEVSDQVMKAATPK